MVTQEHCGLLVRYFRSGMGSGWHTGILVKLDGKTAHIKHPVIKRVQKVPVNDCEPYQGAPKVTIFDHLYSVAHDIGLGPQKPGQSDEQYIEELIVSISKAPDNLWLALPLPAQEWYNAAARAARGRQIIPPCPGFTGHGEIQQLKATDEPKKGITASEILASEPPQEDPQSRFKSSSPRVQPITPDEPKSKPRGKRKTTGVMDALRKVVIIHPDWTSRQVYDYLKLNGFPDAKLDTISVDGGNIRRVIELAKKLGYWKDTVDGEESTEQKQAV